MRRTPPVARPLPGNSPNADTFARPGSVPAIVATEVEIVATTASVIEGSSPKNTASAFGERLMPAIPPAATPCGRTLASPEVQQLGVVRHEDELGRIRALSDPDHLVAILQRDDLEVGRGRDTRRA